MHHLYLPGKYSLSINVTVPVTDVITRIAIYDVFTPSTELCLHGARETWHDDTKKSIKLNSPVTFIIILPYT